MISVCVTTFNGEKYIGEQLDSILSQIGMNDEVIISDDSSVDNTIDIIESFNDSRIKLLKNNKYYNPIYNFENALKKATGDYIFLSDQDDIWMNNKKLEMINLLKDCDCVVSDAIVIDSNNNIINKSFFELNKSKSGLINNIIKNGYLGCCMAFKRKILEKALPFPKQIPMHDMWIGVIAEKYGSVLFYNKPLIYYRRHGNNHSSTAEKSQYSIFKKIRNRFYLICNLIKY